jgi:hypothetical protein
VRPHSLDSYSVGLIAKARQLSNIATKKLLRPTGGRLRVEMDAASKSFLRDDDASWGYGASSGVTERQRLG